MPGDERGQATIEWVALVLIVALALGGMVAAGVFPDGRSFAGMLAHRLLCAVRGDCAAGRAALAAAYGEEDAALVRLHAPSIVYEPGGYSLPVDFRSCRSHRCSDAPDNRDLDVHRSARGDHPATAFTRVIHRDGETFVQYWLYYPSSTTTLAGSAAALRKVGLRPGHHRDDWESYQVRIDRAGNASSRASSHTGYRSCKLHPCEGMWLPSTGWTRVSRGSHAGHVPMEVTLAYDRESDTGVRVERPLYPGVDMRERTTTAAGLALVPLETLDHSGYERLGKGISPPWEKDVYDDPLAGGTA